MALVFKDIELDLSKVPEAKKSEVKEKVANLLYDEVLRYVSRGKSPVAGEIDFKLLDKKYAKKEKQGQRTPNLQLDGDLLRDDFNTKILDDGDIIRIGHFKESTAGTEGEKADGHNQHTAKAQAWALSKPFPKRRYIPSEGQTFKRDILSKVKNVIDRYEVDQTSIIADQLQSRLSEIIKGGQVTTTIIVPDKGMSISIEDILSDDFLAELIGDRLDGAF